MSLLRKISKYLAYRKGLILFYLATALFLTLISFGSFLPWGVIGYTLVILGFLLLLTLAVGFIDWRQKFHSLREIRENLTIDPGSLPKAGNCLEEEYSAIIEGLYQLLNDEKAQAEARKGEISDYYTMWVHQIKTPISGLDLALQSGVTDSAIAEQELFKIRQYVDMALDYTKLSDLASDLMLRDYDVDEIVLEAVRKCSVLFIAKDLGVIAEPTCLRADTDSKWLAFILEQLLTNAAKYTNKGGVRVYGQGRTLRLADSGIGIRPEDRERVFEKGFTGYNGRLDKNASGIGLYLVKTVADALAIEIEVDSQVGKGTTVSLTFPPRLENQE